MARKQKLWKTKDGREIPISDLAMDEMREKKAQGIYKIVANEISQFIDEHKVAVRKPRTWDELPDGVRGYWKDYWRKQVDQILSLT